MDHTSYIEQTFDKIDPKVKEHVILVVTATDIETLELHKKITPLPGFDGVIMTYSGPQTYYWGVFGNYSVVNVQCSMGSISRSGSITTISNALLLLNAKIVIMVGIAFGVNQTDQFIGDVLVAESVIPYNIKRVGAECEVHRGIEAQSSQLLLNRFKNAKYTWKYLTDDGRKASLILARMLSGEELIDNEEYREKLMKEYPNAKGGEMEGIGVYSACDGKAEWILIKGICDFADGHKFKNKVENQTLAIKAALSLCLCIFSSKSAFNDLGVFPIDSNHEISVSIEVKTSDLLFDLYELSKEPYYIKRLNDSVFSQKLKEYGVWVYGPPGCGKSNLILRNLIIENYEYLQVSLASCIGQKIETFFEEILFDLAFKIKGVSSQVQPKNLSECQKAIFDILNKHYCEKELIIFIEEIPISNDYTYKEFSDKFFSLLISKNFYPGLNRIRFVLSSINDPKMQIESFQQKISQQLIFLPFNYWSKEELQKLIALIGKFVPYTLTSEIQEALISESKGSPRFVKKFFRSLNTLERFDDETIHYVIAETKRELN